MPKIGLKTGAVPVMVEDALKRIGQAIRRGRARRGLKHREFASQIGIAAVTLRRVERGSPTTAIGAYFAALHALGLASGVIEWALDEQPPLPKATQ